MKTSIVAISAGVVLILAVFMILYLSKTDDNWQENTEGYVYIGITDDTAAIQGVSRVDLEISKIELRNTAGTWVTASSNGETYDLLELKANERIELHDKVKVPVGTYNEIRITTGDVTIHSTSSSVAAYKTSDIIAFNSQVNVSASTTRPSTLVFDFIADQSLIATADRKQYVFTPVVRVESRTGPRVTVTDDTLIIAEGSVDTNISFGTDLSGTVRQNYVQTGGNIQISTVNNTVRFILDGKTYEGIIRATSTNRAPASNSNVLNTNVQLGN